MWAFLDEQDNIEIFNELPINWKNISNFFALESDLSLLRSMGWYPVVDDSTPITNDFREYHGAPQYSLDESRNVVVKLCEVLTKENVGANETEFDARRRVFLEDLRSRRDRLLLETDWTQMLDVQSTKSEEWKNQYIEYRRWLRDLPQIYSQPPYESVIDSNQVEWRSLPELSE
jgi:hypothetical protein